MSRVELHWPMALVHCVVFATLGALVYTGKLHTEAMLASLGLLVPTAYRMKEGAAPDQR